LGGLASCSLLTSFDGLTGGNGAADAADSNASDATSASSSESASSVDATAPEGSAPATCDGPCPPVVLASGQASPGGIALDDTNVYWMNFGTSPGFGDGALMKAKKDGSFPAQPLLPGVVSGLGLATDGVFTYFSQPYRYSVSRFGPGGTTPISGGDQPGPMIMDRDAGRVFWVDQGSNFANGTMSVQTYSAGVVDTIVTEPGYYAWALDVDSTHVYYSTGANAEGGSVQSFRRVPRAGCGDASAACADTVSMGDYPGRFGLVVDDNQVYWMASASDSILAATKSNLAPLGAIASKLGGSGGVNLAVDEKYVYWTTHAAQGSVRYAPKDGSAGNTSGTLLVDGQTWPFGIVLDADYVYWTNRGTQTDPNSDLYDKQDGQVMRVAKPH
jgi:hypothetical protein